MNRFELLRYERGASRKEVVEATGINERTLGALERGEIKKPGAEAAKALATFYGVTVADLLGVEDRSAAA